MRQPARWLALCALFAAVNAAHAATFQFRYSDDAGEGMNDPTPFTPEGGNNATTLGEARKNVLTEAARIWGTLITSNVPIIIDVTVDPLPCDLNSATLASAGATFVYRDFAGAPQAGVFYPSALADALTNINVSEQSPSTQGSADLRILINATLNNTAGCFGGLRFYYGFDHSNGIQPDLLQVLLHEIAHGLGFSSRVNPTTGQVNVGTDGIERFNSYDQFVFDEAVGASWVTLTATQRQQSAVRTGLLAWNGTNANRWRHRYSAGSSTTNGRLRLYAPATPSQGSSVSHLDTALSPNALMEPNRNNTTNSFTDLTTCVLKDIGWTVTRCIDAANATPAATAQTVSVLEDTPTTIVLAGTDADGDPLTYALAGTPTKGTLSALATVGPPSTLYSPALNANGADSFTFTVTDENSTSPAGTVTISITPVNDQPAAVAKTATVQSGKSVAITLTGTDIDGDALTFTVVTGPASGTISGTPPNITYTANSGFTGADSFTYRANDATLSSTPVTVSITVTPASSTGGGGGGNGGGGGGGGATGLPLLALLAGLLARQRWRAARAGS